MPTVLFICTGNTCRSPMAEGFLKIYLAEQGLDGWAVGSAGTLRMRGNPAAEHSEELVRRAGGDISRHRAREVNDKLLTAADLVLTMERNHKEALLAEFPIYADRIYMLSELVGLERDVVDPVGGPFVEYAETAEEIWAYLKDGFPRLLELAAFSGEK